MGKSLEERYTELSKKIHEERSKPNNICDMGKVEEYERNLAELEKEMGVKRID